MGPLLRPRFSWIEDKHHPHVESFTRPLKQPPLDMASGQTSLGNTPFSIGPSLFAIAQSYHTDELREVLARKLKNGGVGVWGGVPAPAMPNISEEEVGELARWVASHR